MKVLKDEALPIRLKIPMEEAKEMAFSIGQSITDKMVDNFNNNKNYQSLNKSDAQSYILKCFSILFLKGIEFTDFVGRHFPDTENNYQELFEETIEGLRLMLGFETPQRAESKNEIKSQKK